MKGKRLNAHGTVGSVLIAKAYVTNKYIEESDKTHRIEMIVWTEENFDGDLCQAAKVTVILPSKGDLCITPFPVIPGLTRNDRKCLKLLDSRLRGNDEITTFVVFCKGLKG